MAIPIMPKTRIPSVPPRDIELPPVAAPVAEADQTLARVTEADQTAPREAPAAPHDVEACAAAVLAMLPKHIADHIREVAYVYNRQPLWSLVAGHCYKSYENGDVQAPLMDPSWPRLFPNVGVDPSKQVATCEQCQGSFTPKRYKERYCSQACGAIAAKLQFTPKLTTA